MKRKLVRWTASLAAIAAIVTVSAALYGNCEKERLRELAQLVANDVNNPEITVRFIEHTLVLEGAANEPEQARAKQIAEAYLTAPHLRNLWQPPRLLALFTDIGQHPLSQTNFKTSDETATKN